MKEEFHGNGNEGGTWIHKLLYGWGTINTNIWLPSVSELTGCDLNNYRESTGTYYSAMQSLNLTNWYYVDAKGGTQFAYFKQYNASGGGERIWNACKQQVSWLRSSVFAYPDRATVFSGTDGISHIGITESRAVHPAVFDKVFCHSK